MRLDIGHKGDWLVDPRDLAARLGVNTAELKRLNRLGQVDARLASGSGDDTGLTCITVRLHDSGWRGIFDQSGALIHEDMWLAEPL